MRNLMLWYIKSAIPRSRDALHLSPNDENILSLANHNMLILNDGMLLYDQSSEENSFFQPTSSDLSAIVSHIMAQRTPVAKASRERIESNNTVKSNKNKQLVSTGLSEQNAMKLLSSVVPPWPKFSNPLPSWKPWPLFESITDKLPDVLPAGQKKKTDKGTTHSQDGSNNLNKNSEPSQQTGADEAPLSDDDDGLDVGDHIINAASAKLLQEDSSSLAHEEEDIQNKFYILKVCIGSLEDCKWADLYWATVRCICLLVSKCVLINYQTLARALYYNIPC